MYFSRSLLGLAGGGLQPREPCVPGKPPGLRSSGAALGAEPNPLSSLDRRPRLSGGWEGNDNTLSPAWSPQESTDLQNTSGLLSNGPILQTVGAIHLYYFISQLSSDNTKLSPHGCRLLLFPSLPSPLNKQDRPQAKEIPQTLLFKSQGYTWLTLFTAWGQEYRHSPSIS